MTHDNWRDLATDQQLTIIDQAKTIRDLRSKHESGRTSAYEQEQRINELEHTLLVHQDWFRLKDERIAMLEQLVRDLDYCRDIRKCWECRHYSKERAECDIDLDERVKVVFHD